MLDSCKDEFIKMMHDDGVIDEPLCIGFGMEFSDLKIGMEFIVSPNFAFPFSKDTWTLQDALKINGGNWKLDVNGSVDSFYSDKFKVIKKNKRFNVKNSFAFLRVKNLRTNVDFDILRDSDEIDELDTINLYFIQ